MKTIEEIKEILRNHKGELKEKFKVKEIGIFGSYVKGTQKDKSDIDILVGFETPIDFFTFLELEEFLTELLGVKVDLVMKKALKPEIGKHILSEVLYV
ncbi:MAG: nucleotidyltransferase family protein [Candidatus Aenigmatarchaeota archaeon]